MVMKHATWIILKFLLLQPLYCTFHDNIYTTADFIFTLLTIGFACKTSWARIGNKNVCFKRAATALWFPS
jgi:hypothetical protein